MQKNFDLVIAGVGGQGNILLSRILAETALGAGCHVQISDTFGAAQRGAAVLSHVRFGRSYSPVIPEGRGDALLALEPIEALRQSRFLAANGLAVVNSQQIMPVEVASGKVKYPPIDTIRNLLTKLTRNLFMVNAAATAEEAGDRRTANIVMLGVLDATHVLPFETTRLKETIRTSIAGRMVDVNLKAFDLGRALLEKQMKQVTPHSS